MKDPFEEAMKSLDNALTFTIIALIASTFFVFGALVATVVFYLTNGGTLI